MKEKTLLLLLWHFAVLGAIALAMLMFPEEMIQLKANLRRDLNSAKNNIQTSTFSEFDSRDPIALEETAWYQDPPLIYHAGGGIDGLTYTNSREALENTLALGNRFVEMDFLFTSDRQLVCAHDWHDISDSRLAMTAEEFRNLKIYGKYTSLTAAELIAFMQDYEDLYIVIDTKEEDMVSVVLELVRLAGEEPTLCHRFIIQLYDSGIRQQLQERYDFNDFNFLFTAYKFGTENPAQIMKLCYQENVPVITVEYGKWNEATIQKFKDKGFVILEHTVNRPDEAAEALARGVDGLYTDFLSTADMK